MTGELDSIVELGRALEHLRSVRERLAGVPDWMRELHTNHQTKLAEIEALQETARAAERERRTAEAAVADAQAKLQQYQKQISRVSTQREYGALLKEIDTVKQQILGFEEQALDALERHEAAEKGLAEERVAFAELDGRYQLELRRWEEEKPALQADAERLEGSIEVVRQRLPRNLLAQFDRLYERFAGQPMAPLVRMERTSGPAAWHCGTCHYRVRPQVVVEIQSQGSVRPCDSCGRILYPEPGNS
jgi:predicted  nucleic acid-binding Zn-ribbon protein